MRKIACIGTHSVGKSTLCYQLAEKAKREGKSVHIIQERVRFSPFPINDKMKIETSIWASTNQISKELEASTRGFDVIISDRSPFDPFVYAEHFGLLNGNSKALMSFAVTWLRSYDKIYFIRMNELHKASEDGVRSTDMQFIKNIDNLFFSHIDRLKIPVETIFTSEVFK